MAPTPQAELFCEQGDIIALLSQAGVDARLDDDADGVVSAEELEFLDRARNWATSKIKYYCGPLYDSADLATSYLVAEWASILATYYVCVRRVNPCPDSIHELTFGRPGTEDHGVMGDLKEVRNGLGKIPDIGYRNMPLPAWSITRVDPRYRFRQLRVVKSSSERTPTQYPQTVDWFDSASWEY
jgi:hypothetical protein